MGRSNEKPEKLKIVSGSFYTEERDNSITIPPATAKEMPLEIVNGLEMGIALGDCKGEYEKNARAKIEEGTIELEQENVKIVGFEVFRRKQIERDPNIIDLEEKKAEKKSTSKVEGR